MFFLQRDNPSFTPIENYLYLLIILCGKNKENGQGPALFWTITQRMVVALYRRFGTIYRSHLQGSRGLDS